VANPVVNPAVETALGVQNRMWRSALSTSNSDMLCPPAEFEVEHPIFTPNYTNEVRLRGLRVFFSFFSLPGSAW
jgi:hypothetical protein